MLVIDVPATTATSTMRWRVSTAKEVTGGLSNPNKMPGYSYNIPAWECKVGSALRELTGSVCSKCYARKGRYVLPTVKEALYRRLACLQNPQWVEAMAFLINWYYVRKDFGHFRWHDSGDLQSEEHLIKICQVCILTPEVEHWLPTKELQIVRSFRQKYQVPHNLTIRASAFYLNKNPVKAAEDLPISTVYTKGNAPENAHLCPALGQDHKCGDCRACWDKGVKHVAYPAI